MTIMQSDKEMQKQNSCWSFSWQQYEYLTHLIFRTLDKNNNIILVCLMLHNIYLSEA